MMALLHHRRQARHQAQDLPPEGAAGLALIAAIAEMTTLGGATSPLRIAKNALESSMLAPLHLRAMGLHRRHPRQCRRLQRPQRLRHQCRLPRSLQPIATPTRRQRSFVRAVTCAQIVAATFVLVLEQELVVVLQRKAGSACEQGPAKRCDQHA